MDTRIYPRLAWCMIVAAAVLLLIPVGGSSQEQVTGSPACVLEPVSLPLFGATPAAVIAASPAAVIAASPAADTGNRQPAPDAASVEQAVEAIVACINSRNPAFRYAVFTDRYLAERLANSDSVYQPAFERQLDSGVGEEVPQYALESIEQISPLDDGRVSVVVTLSADGARYRDQLVLAEVDGTLLIDEVTLIEPASPGAGS